MTKVSEITDLNSLRINASPAGNLAAFVIDVTVSFPAATDNQHVTPSLKQNLKKNLQFYFLVDINIFKQDMVAMTDNRFKALTTSYALDNTK